MAGSLLFFRIIDRLLGPRALPPPFFFGIFRQLSGETIPLPGLRYMYP